MKKAFVYLREDTIYAVAVATTAAGVTINTDRVVKLDRGISPQKLGRAVMDSLETFKEGVSELRDWRDHAAPMLRALGFKSLRVFEKNACFVNVIEEDGAVTIIPTVALKRGGFIALTNLPDGGEVQCGLDAEQIGQAILGRFELCQSQTAAQH